MEDYRIGLPTSLWRPDGSAEFPSYDLRALEELPGVRLTRFESRAALTPADLQGLDAAVLLGERLEAASLPADGRLLHVARMGVGYDTVDVAACTAADIVLTITPDAVRRPMAVASLGYLLAITGRLLIKDRMTRRGPDGWAERTRHHGMGLTGRTLGIVGLGNIGLEFARLAAPLEMRMIGHDPFVDPAAARAQGIELVALDDLFRRADVVSLNCPLTEATHHLVNAERLALMKPEAFLINTARGPVVDQPALVAALQAGTIAGAALDVQEQEPSPADEPLHALDNVILAPHALGWTDELWANMARINEADMRAVLRGEAPGNAVNPEVFERPGFQARLKDLAERRGGA